MECVSQRWVQGSRRGSCDSWEKEASNYPGSRYRGWAGWAWGTGEQVTSLLLDKEVPPPSAHQLVPGRSILSAVA